MQEAEKTKPSRTKRESSRARATDAKSKSKTDTKTSSRSTRSKPNSKAKPEEKEPYTKPSPRTLRKSSSSNAKVDLKAPPPNTTITKVKSSSKTSSRAGETSNRTFSKSKEDGKSFSTSKRSSKTSSSKSPPEEARKPVDDKVSSKSRRSTESKSSLETKSSKDVSRRRNSRDETSSLRSTISSKNPSKDKTRDSRRSEEKSRRERSKESKDGGRKEKTKRDEVSKERKSSQEKKKNKSEVKPNPPVQPPIDDTETTPEDFKTEKLDAGDGELLVSLDTQESGISVSSPQPPMSRDDSVEEEEVEGSISSKYVEVGDADEVDEMIAVVEEEPEIVIEEEPEVIIEEEPEIVIEEEPEIIEEEPDVIEEEPEIAELSEDSGVIGTEGSSGFEAPAENLETSKENHDNDGVNKGPSSDGAPIGQEEEEEDDYGDDDFEDYESDFEDTDEEESEHVSNNENDSENYDDNDEGSLTTDDETDEQHTGETSAQPPHSVGDDPGTAMVLQKAIMESMRQDDSDGESKPERPKTSKSFVNFAKLKEKHGVNQTAQADSRGLTLLSMITLDTVSVDLLTLQPINYDAFISSFGLTNTQQASSQTNEDNLSQETQTDEVTMLTKWTQQPICVNVSNMEEPPTPQDYLGVGGEIAEVTTTIDSFSTKDSGNVGRLTKFLAAASQVVLTLLEEESVYRSSSDYDRGSLGHGTGGGGFSNHGVLLGGTSNDTTPSFSALLANSAVMCLRFSASDASVVATGHSFCDENITSPDTETDYSVAEKSNSGLVVVWSVHEPSLPKYILRCNSTPKTLAFSPGRPLLVMAGLGDSTIAVWDLKEPGHLHPNMTIDEEYNLIHVDLTENVVDPKNSALVWRCRVPSFITACSDSGSVTQRNAAATKNPESSSSKGSKKKSKQHKNPPTESPDVDESPPELDLSSSGSPIICLRTVDVAAEEQHAWDSNAFQVVSLSSHGELVWWVVVQIRDRSSLGDEGSEVSISAHAGASPWSRITVNKAYSYSVLLPNSADLYDRMGCTDCELSPSDPSTVYVSTDSGAVRHINRLNSRTSPQAFLPEMEPSCSATCVCVCPHLPSYLLVGCGDGSVRLHSLSSARPLTTWPAPDLNNPRPVVQITWSHERPCVFYVHEHERIHVWDLSAGDMSPITSLDTDALMGEEGPMIFSLAPARLFNRDVVNAMFGSRSGRLILRKIESDFLSESPEEKELELERFKFYATII